MGVLGRDWHERGTGRICTTTPARRRGARAVIRIHVLDLLLPTPPRDRAAAACCFPSSRCPHLRIMTLATTSETGDLNIQHKY